MNTFNPLPIDQVMKNAQQCFDNEVKWARERLERRVKQVEDSYRILPLLEGLGGVEVSFWRHYADEVSIHLGEMPRRGRAAKEEFARKMREVRRAVGFPLVEQGKDAHMETKEDGKVKTVHKFIKVTLKAKECPGVKVTYLVKPKKSDRCKLVRKRNVSTDFELVCEV